MIYVLTMPTTPGTKVRNVTPLRGHTAFLAKACSEFNNQAMTLEWSGF